MSQYRVGIDLGTTNTVCCTFRDTFEFIKIKSSYILPSVVMYKNGEIKVGDSAKQRAIRNPENVITSSKTYMGDFSKQWEIDGRVFTPTDVATEILKEVKRYAEKYFQTDEVIDAVITVPAYFTSSQYDETKKAAEMAGFRVLRLVAEPIAAAIAYGLDEKVNSIFVVDIGGGTFDVSLLKETKNPDGSVDYETIACDGDGKLGGDDFDQVIVNLCYSKIRREYGIDLSNLSSSGLNSEEFSQARQMIRKKAEMAKIALSDAEETNIVIANLCSKNNSPVTFNYTLSRDEFEKSCTSLFNKIQRVLQRFVDNQNIDLQKVGKVIFVGGSSNIPHIKAIVRKCLKQEPYADKDLSKLVAMGAALCAADKDTLISAKLVIRDILSHSLGIEVRGEKIAHEFAPILRKNEKYPISRTKEFYTVNDYQESATIKVYEGESRDISENFYYGEFTLDNIKQGLSGVPIQVNFEINEDRQLIVSAWDEATGSKKSITIEKGIKL